MVASNPRLRTCRKTRQRLDHAGELAPRVVQIAGADPGDMAQAARFNVDQGAQIIDINMGCPAKKVCNVMAGSALLRDEPLIGRIIDAVVKAVRVPVTLKIRTGWDPDHRNAVAVARLAQTAGIQALAVHGRTRACGYRGPVDYETIRAVKAAVSIPVIANGDIDGPEIASMAMAATGADAVMIGRAAQGRPWIFHQVAQFLSTGERLAEPSLGELRDLILGHLEALYGFYGEIAGVRIARKHLSWYCKERPAGNAFRDQVNRVETAGEQLTLTQAFLEQLGHKEAFSTR
jgi:tRNA-dihydrouridine synthase B